MFQRIPWISKEIQRCLLNKIRIFVNLSSKFDKTIWETLYAITYSSLCIIFKQIRTHIHYITQVDNALDVLISPRLARD